MNKVVPYLKAIYEKQLVRMFPERLLLGTPWHGEFREEHRARTVTITKYFGVVTAVTWAAHHWLYDIPEKLEPAEVWVQFRILLTLVGILCAVLAFIPAVSRSKAYWLPLAITGFMYSVGEAYMMRYSTAIHIFVPAIFTFFHVLLLRVNPFWSLSYGALITVCQFPTFALTHAQNMPMAYSSITTIFIAIYFSRAGALNEMKAFVNVRKLALSQKNEADAKQKILTKELELTAAVQSLLMPQKEIAGDSRFEIIGKNIPASECGGDWWWHEHDGDTVRVMLADVTGHGAAPAMITASVFSLTKVLYDPAKPFGDMLTELQNHFHDHFGKSKYWMTLTACELNLATGQLKSWFAGAPPIFWVRSSGDVDAISETGSPLGSTNDCFGYVETQLSPGDKLVFATDGMVEAKREKNGKEIGERRIRDELGRNRASSARALIDNFLSYVNTERGQNPQEDDYTFFVIDYISAAKTAASA